MGGAQSYCNLMRKVGKRPPLKECGPKSAASVIAQKLGNRHTRESAIGEKVQDVDPRVINLRAVEPPLILLRRILTQLSPLNRQMYANGEFHPHLTTMRSHHGMVSARHNKAMPCKSNSQCFRITKLSEIPRFCDD